MSWISAVTPIEWILSLILITSAIGVISFRQPIHACVSFLVTLFALAGWYLHFNAQLIAALQILVYAGAILVLFIFVVVLFQDAHHEVNRYPAKSSWGLRCLAIVAFISAMVPLIFLTNLTSKHSSLSKNFGEIQALGHILYLDFFFPFEATILLFLVGTIGVLYIGKKVK